MTPSRFYIYAIVSVTSLLIGIEIGQQRPPSLPETAYLRNAPFDPKDDLNLASHAEECALVISGPVICKDTLRAMTNRIRRTR